MLKSNTCSHPLARTCCCLRTNRAKADHDCRSRGQTYKPQGKHTRTSCICRCKDLARCLLLPPMLKSNTCSRLSLAPAAASGPIAPKPETTIVDRGVKPTNHKGKHTHISCRCECLARLPFIAARASSPLVTCSFASTSS